MERRFDRAGPAGRSGMCSTAAVQVCLDAGEGAEVADRWEALHALGPTPLHRRSFPKVRAAIEKDAQPELVFEIVGSESFESHPPQVESASVGMTQHIVETPQQAA